MQSLHQRFQVVQDINTGVKTRRCALCVWNTDMCHLTLASLDVQWKKPLHGETCHVLILVLQNRVSSSEVRINKVHVLILIVDYF